MIHGMTDKQFEALEKVWARTEEPPTDQFGKPYTDFEQFRKSCWLTVGGDCVMVGWQHMVLGIEEDGHVHS